ncbi:MAG: hypothetical protein K2H18_04250, partial [Muribaculaceae bacterium]|nr:hypothetical protein [Muribaculaceae bacterium]
FEESSLICERIKQLSAANKKLTDKRKEVAKLRKELPILKEREEKCIREIEVYNNMLAPIKEEIASLTEKRTKLAPAELSEKINKVTSRKDNLNSTLQILLTTENSINLYRKSAEEFKGLSKVVTSMKEEAATATAEADKNSKLLEEARNRYATMHLSVEKNFSLLRQRLVNEHAETCPLCGQHKHWEPADAESEMEFNAILSPLLSECEQLEHTVKQANKIKDEKVREYNRMSGKLQSDSSHLDSIKKEMTENLQKLNSSLSIIKKEHPLTAESSHELFNSIEIFNNIETFNNQEIFNSIENNIKTLLSSTEEELKKMSEISAEAERLQNIINEKIKDSESLEKTLTDSNNSKNIIVTEIKLAKHRITSFEEEIDNLCKNITAYESTIEKSVISLYPKWRENLAETIKNLERESKRFKALCDEINSLEKEIKSESEKLKNLKDLSQEIEKILSYVPEISYHSAPKNEEDLSTTTVESKKASPYARVEADQLSFSLRRLFGRISSLS